MPSHMATSPAGAQQRASSPSGTDALLAIRVSLSPCRAMPALPITAPVFGFEGPVKRSITIAGHQTSISLEPVFWHALETAAAARALPLSALVAQIDVLRIAAVAPPNLASALRTWLFAAATALNYENVTQ